LEQEIFGTRNIWNKKYLEQEIYHNMKMFVFTPEERNKLKFILQERVSSEYREVWLYDIKPHPDSPDC
jgi:hypothetical protein